MDNNKHNKNHWWTKRRDNCVIRKQKGVFTVFCAFPPREISREFVSQIFCLDWTFHSKKTTALPEQKLQSGLHLGTWAGLGEETPGSHPALSRLILLFILWLLFRQEMTLLWKQREGKLSSSLCEWSGRRFRTSPRCRRQLQDRASVKVDRRTWKKTMSEVLLLSGISNLNNWNYTACTFNITQCSQDGHIKTWIMR